MERWDFDCQKCGRQIGDYAYVHPEWYRCPQEANKETLLEKVYPTTKFVVLLKNKKIENMNVLHNLNFHESEHFSADFHPKDISVLINDKSVQKKVVRAMESAIKWIIINNLRAEAFYQTAADFYATDSSSLGEVNIYFDKFTLKYHLDNKQDEYYKKAGIKKHIIKSSSGWGRLGYAFDIECAKKLDYKCDVCGSELEKITADRHPGGHWGIRDLEGKIIREPGEMH